MTQRKAGPSAALGMTRFVNARKVLRSKREPRVAADGLKHLVRARVGWKRGGWREGRLDRFFAMDLDVGFGAGT